MAKEKRDITSVKQREKRNNYRLTDKQVEFALRFCKGNCSEAGRMLGVYPQTVRRRVRRRPELQKIIHEAREGLIDLAEGQLEKLVKAGDKDAIKMALQNRHGRTRGYGPEGKGLDLSFDKRSNKVTIRVIDD